MISSVSGNKIEYDIRAYRYHRKTPKDKSEAPLKAKVITGSVAGTVLPMMFLAKKQNAKLLNIK